MYYTSLQIVEVSVNFIHEYTKLESSQTLVFKFFQSFYNFIHDGQKLKNNKLWYSNSFKVFIISFMSDKS